MDKVIREEFRQQVVSADVWTVDAARGRPMVGEAKGMYVLSKATGRCGYMKPTKKSGSGRTRAAYEKIAADLAFETGMSVPPAVLYVRTDANPNEESNVVISLIPPDPVHQWKHFANATAAPVVAQIEGLLKAGSDIIAFDAWLGNTDRHNRDNTIFSGDANRLAYFLDFSNSMDYENKWSAGSFTKFSKADPRHEPFIRCLKRDTVCDAACRIDALPESIIRDIVNRIPDVFLQPNAKKNLVDWLIWRQKMLCEKFDDWYPGKDSW